MPYLRTRLEVAARLRLDGQFGASLPSTADAYADLNYTLAWWWTLLSREERAGVGSLTSTVTATPGQSFVAMPATQRQVREVYRAGYDWPAVATTKIAYGRPTYEPSLPGCWWPEYRVTPGQVIELRPTPTSAETITIVGTSAPPQWTDDVVTVDLLDEDHERAIVDVTRARIHFRDDESKRAAAERAAADSLRDSKGWSVPDTPTPWHMFKR
jgi:hypothetical protein